MLGADLDLPVPEPFVVQVEPDFIAAIPDPEIRKLASESQPWAFGSKKLPPQFSTLMSGIPLAQSLLPTAAEVLAFDTLIANPDRRTVVHWRSTITSWHCKRRAYYFGVRHGSLVE
jgi:hypothetical protein